MNLREIADFDRKEFYKKLESVSGSVETNPQTVQELCYALLLERKEREDLARQYQILNERVSRLGVLLDDLQQELVRMKRAT